MSRKQEELLPTTQPEHFIEISLYWNDGYNGPKGYRLSIGPVTIQNRNGYQSKGYGICSGFGKTIEQAPRFNARKLADLWAKRASFPEYAEFLSKVLAKGNYTLQQEAS
jgi:hypothetical protein